MSEHISGVILYDETLRQSAKDGTPLTKLITDAGSIPGIKVDMGAKPLAGAEGETITEGLDGLRDRLADYYELGARFGLTQENPGKGAFQKSGQGARAGQSLRKGHVHSER